MTTSTECHLRTGGDPRTLSDYALLRDEMNKLTHPARPDVNWQQAEKLCLSLFESNGIELQTGAWYTLARTQRAGLYGLNEGLAILAALITHQWGCLWPQPVPVRMEILNGLSRRLQQVLRTLILTPADLSQLYRAEQQLSAIGEVLQCLDLKYLAGTEALRQQLHAATVRLEISVPASGTTETLPPVAVPSDDTGPAITEHPEILRDDDSPAVRRIYVARPEPVAAGVMFWCWALVRKEPENMDWEEVPASAWLSLLYLVLENHARGGVGTGL